jgi:hypothetical protein
MEGGAEPEQIPQQKQKKYEIVRDTLIKCSRYATL